MIKIEHLTKIYTLNNNNMIKALDDVSFEVKDEEIFGIMGISGSGKSTLMKILRGVEPFDEGKIIINDITITPENYSEYKNYLKEKTAIHLQRSFGLWSKTALENIIHKLVGLKTGDETTTFIDDDIKEEYKDEALDLLETVGLKNKADHFAPVLSGGEKQRLVLARQLAKKPEILLLDEPATMSSPKIKKEILDTIKRINEKYHTTVILVSHQPEIQEYLADEIILVYNGHVKKIGKPKEIIEEFLSEEDPEYPIAKLDRTENIIKVRNLTKDFYLFKGGHVLTIEDVNFDINKGEIVSIIGPSGSGKTGILRMMGGFDLPDSGTIEIKFNNKWTKMDEYGENRMQIRKNMGFMHQDFSLTPHTPIITQIATKISPKLNDVFENAVKKAEEIGLSKESLDIIYQLTDLSRNEAINKLEKINLGPEILDILFPPINKKEVVEYITPIFEALDLPLPLLSREFAELSGGQKVRVAIASVLASNPEILILDEPFGDLDPVTLRIVANSLKKINEKFNTTIILVSHTMEFVKEVSTHSILIDDGKVVGDGKPEEVIDKFIKLNLQINSLDEHIKKYSLELLLPKNNIPSPSNWITLKLGDISSISTGNKDLKDNKSDGKYPFFVRSKEIKRIDTYSYDGEAILIPGDGKIGEIYHYIIGKFDYHQRVYKISDFDKNILGKYVFYYMQQHFLREAKINSAKATVDSLRLSTIKNMKIKVPEYEKQIKITQYLESIDKKIELTNKEIKLLKKYKKGLLQQMFC